MALVFKVFKTKYLSATDTKGSRIRVTGMSMEREVTRIVPFDYGAPDSERSSIDLIFGETKVTRVATINEVSVWVNVECQA
jgi:hypothetical protein